MKKGIFRFLCLISAVLRNVHFVIVNTITGSSSAPTLVDVKHAVETALLKLTMSMKLHFSAVRLPRLKGRICFSLLEAAKSYVDSGSRIKGFAVQQGRMQLTMRY